MKKLFLPLILLFGFVSYLPAPRGGGGTHGGGSHSYSGSGGYQQDWSGKYGSHHGYRGTGEAAAFGVGLGVGTGIGAATAEEPYEESYYEQEQE